MSPQAGFLLQDQVLPRLISAIPQAVSFIGSEDAKELVQDGTLIAAQMIHNAEQAGKEVVRNPGAGRRGARKVRTISAGNIAYYTIQKLKCGRRSTDSSVVDVYGSGTQINGHTRLTSLDESMASVDDVGEPLLLHDVLSTDQEDPATKAARRIDWQMFMAGLSKKERVMIESLSEGKTFEEVGQKCNASYSAIQGSKRDLAVNIQEFMGINILAEVRCLAFMHK
jgi:DNA-binding CsgD family transcriptional regulator